MFCIAHVSLILICILFFIVIGLKVKNKLRRYFTTFCVEVFIWLFSVLAQKYCADFGYTDTGWIMFFENLTYVGISLIPASMLIICSSFVPSKGGKKINRHIFYVIPALTQIVIWTNPLHHMFYVSYDYFDKNGILLGWYFYLHVIYSYACLIIGIYYVFSFALNSKGNSHWQAILIGIGTVTPFVVNICYTFNIGNFFTIFSTPIAFTITILAYFLGIFRFNLLRITPIAMRTVIDLSSELYIVFDEYMNILDFNEPFSRIFSHLANFKRNENLTNVLNKKNETGISAEDLCRVIETCRDSRTAITKDFTLIDGKEIKNYSAEFTPLIIDNAYCGCILLLSDITQAIRYTEEIKRNQKMLIEQERLASLGQLMGGLAHNFKTPIMAISGRTENLKVLIEEYEESLSDSEVTVNDYIEIAQEMKQELEKIRSHLSYMSDIITTVKDQTVKFTVRTQGEFFTVGDLVKRVNILMQHELIRHNCELAYEIAGDETAVNGIAINGEINALVQVIDNIIMNAIQAYNGVKGKIRLKISQTPKTVDFSICDDAGGIPKDIQKKLFNQMITSKGKDGTGLGLYISFSTVVGIFDGKIWFDSIEGQGTEFFISIPFEADVSDVKHSCNE